ncbi:hypothetical protein EVG20_g6837, partial [Dentipellis fragilis]
MSRFDMAVAQHGPDSPENAVFVPTVPDERHAHERDGSLSSSEDSLGYPHYAQSSKTESDTAEDTQLTAQTLNNDGTPKRPMNAFMIFARRRRPQVSAENQMMRTGEISKILSKEWNSMDASDKQFYLNQAKRLKETFNTKYPDYVYRRRPNNSRRKRRSDATLNPPHNPSPSGDTGDDVSGFQDYEYPTAGNGDEAAYSSQREFAASRSGHHPGALGYDGSAGLQHPHGTTASYSYPISELPSNHFSPSRVSQISPLHHRSPSDVSSSLSSLTSHSHPYGSRLSLPDNHLPPASAYSSDSMGDYGFWNGAEGLGRGSRGRSSSSSAWPLIPPLNAGGARDRALGPGPSGMKHDMYSPPPHRPWSTATSHTSSSASSTSPQLSAHRYHPISSSFFASEDPAVDSYRPSVSTTPNPGHADAFSSSVRLHEHASYGSRGAGAIKYDHVSFLSQTTSRIGGSPYPHGSQEDLRPLLHHSRSSTLPHP